MLDDLGDGRDRIHGHVFHDGRFPGILDRHEQPLDASTAAGQRHGERAVDGLDSALQGDFPHHHELPQDRRRDDPFRRQDPHGDGQIKRGAFLAEVRRGQVDGDFALGKAETAVAQRRTDPLATFPHRQVRKPDHREHGQPGREVHLHLDGVGVQSAHRHAVDLRQHMTHCPLRHGKRGKVKREEA